MNEKISMERIFSHIYENNVWGDNGLEEYRGSSGPGSSKEYNLEYVKFVNEFIEEKNIKKVIDVGCGDWRIGEILFSDKEIDYTGYDVYNELINYLNSKHGSERKRFIKLDASSEKEKIKSADLLLCKDVLQHWDNASVVDFVNWAIDSKKFKYVMITNCRGFNLNDVLIGGWRGLGFGHPLLSKFSRVFSYKTKDVLLYAG